MKTKETLEIGQKVSWIVRNTNITGVVLNDDLSGQVIVISHLVGNKPHNQ